MNDTHAYTPTNRAFNYNNIKYIIFLTTATKMEWIEFLVVVTRASISNLLNIHTVVVTGHFDSVVHDKVTNSPIGHRG